jgi:hypothetical protein
MGIMGLFLVAMLLLPATVQAQATDINLQDIAARLGPSNQMPCTLFDIMRYLLFFLGFICVLLIPDKQLLPSLLMTGVLGLLIIAKLNVFTPDALPMLAINSGIFVIPLIVAGMLRNVNGKPPKARGPAIIAGLLGGGHFFLFWALAQQVAAPACTLV